MQIEIIRPNEGYPLVYAYVFGVSKNDIDVSDFLARNKISLLGPWTAASDESSESQGVTKGYRAPALMEDEYVKPRTTAKKTAAKKTAAKKTTPRVPAKKTVSRRK